MNLTILFDTFMLFFILHIFVYYTSSKVCADIVNINSHIFYKIIFIMSFGISSINFFNPPLLYKLLLMLISCIFLVFTYLKHSILHSILISIISLLINYCIYFISTFIVYTFCFFTNINNHIFVLIFIFAMHYILWKKLFGTKRFKNGFFIVTDKYVTNIYFTFMLIFFFIVILFLVLQIPNDNGIYCLCVAFVLTLIMFTVYQIIKKAITFNYKQRLITKELEDNKNIIKNFEKIIDSKDKEINRLLLENIKTSKTFHSISHKHDSLEFKIKKYEMKADVDSLADMYKLGPVPLLKIGSDKIDDMLEYLQNECYSKKIDFDLQLYDDACDFSKFISETSLEILIADLIRNAIISIEHSNSTNNSILVKLGKINNIYSVYVYDSGIEFDINTYSTLGLTPSSSHLDNGGTGMGFLNIFDTLNLYCASLSISEIGPVCDDNYTKSIAIKFNNQNTFNIYSYRDDLLNSNINNDSSRIIIDKYLS